MTINLNRVYKKCASLVLLILSILVKNYQAAEPITTLISQSSSKQNSSSSSSDDRLSKLDNILFSIFFLGLATLAIGVGMYVCYKIKIEPCLNNAKEKALQIKEKLAEEKWITGQKNFPNLNRMWQNFEQSFREFIVSGQQDRYLTENEKALFEKIIHEIIQASGCSSMIKEKLENKISLEISEFNVVIKILELKLFCPVTFQPFIFPSTAGSSISLYEYDTLKRCKIHPETRERNLSITINEKAVKYVEHFFDQLEKIYLIPKPLLQSASPKKYFVATPFASQRNISSNSEQVITHDTAISNVSSDENTPLIS